MPLSFSRRALRTQEQPISYFMQQAVENPNLISLAAGLVDEDSLPVEEVKLVLDDIFADADTARAALQYGTTQGYLPLRKKILERACQLDGLSAADLNLTVNDVVVGTGSQQLLYLLGEVLLDEGDIVITEAPSYFVYHGALTSFGVRVLAVPMDEQGMNTDQLEDLLTQLEKQGELERVKMIYTVDYFQNPTGLTLSLERRKHLMELVRRFSRRHRILVLEDAAYRELRYDGDDVPSLKSFDPNNEHVLLTMTFSKPWAPGLKTGYGIFPTAVTEALLRFKGNHDFGSSNLNQHILNRVLDNGMYEQHLGRLCEAYRAKRDAMLEALHAEFGEPSPDGMNWTFPEGGLYVWLTCPQGMTTSRGGALMNRCLEEGVLFVPGAYCYMPDELGRVPDREARLCFGVATCEQIHEAVRRLGRAAATAGAVCV